MHADATSLKELGLLPDASGAWPLASWLDNTHARPSYDALTRLIASPLADTDGICARQALLLQLVSVAKEVPWADLQVLAVQVEGFLSSNYVIVPTALMRRTVFAARFGDIVTYVTKQLRAVDTLLTLSDQVYGRIGALRGDATFVGVVTALEMAAEHPQRERLRAAVADGHALSLAGLDGMVRNKSAGAAQGSKAVRNDAPLRDVLEALVAAIWQLDAFCSLATASAAVGGVLPRVVTKGEAAMSMDGLRHPLLPKGVTNDVHLADAERVFFLTGPNMAGKSTLLRALGIAVYCAHLGMAVAARVACIPMFDQLLVSMTVRDNLQRGESLYLAEIRRVRTIVEAVDRGDAVMAIFDEVFRGTNIKDAVQATLLLVDGLARAPHGMFVIASHLAEVAESRAEHAGMGCWCMDVDITGDSPKFTHRVRRGVSDVHLGMVLLDAKGVGPVLRRMAAGSLG